MENFKGMDYLKAKLRQKRPGVELRYDYYEMKNVVPDMGISTPPELRWWVETLGWCSIAVDSLADRLVFRTFDNDALNMSQIFDDNNKDVLADSAILSALISSCSFIYIANDENGYPRMRVIDGDHATGIIDPVTNMLKEGYAVLEYNTVNEPILEAYFLPGTTFYYTEGVLTQVIKNDAPYPLLVPMINRPDAKRPFGHSRISRACMSIVRGAARTVKRSEIAAEFYSFPQKYVLGMSEEAEEMDKWNAAMSTMLRIDKDSDGDRPVVGQFQSTSMSPHTEQLRMFAGLFAGETGLTLDDLGFPSQNPSSAEAIKSSHERLRLIARKAQRGFGTGFLNAGYLAACVRDKQQYKRQELAKVIPKWEPIFEPDAAGMSVIGDGIIKINQAIPGYFGKDNAYDIVGIKPEGDDSIGELILPGQLDELIIEE